MRLIRGERDNIRAMQRAQGEAFGRMDGLYWTSLAFLSRPGGLPVTKRRGLTDLTISLTLALFARALKTFRSIQYLSRIGDGPNAHVLARSLFETMLAVHFLLQRDSHRRSVMYLAYLSHQKRKTLNSWKDTPGLRRWWTKGRDAAITGELAEAARVIGAARVEQVRRHWSGSGSLEQAAMRLNQGARRAYQIFYRVSSRHAHPEDPGEHAERLSGEHSLKFEADPEMVGRAMGTACTLMWSILKRVNDRLGSGADAQIARHAPRRGRP